MFLRLRKILVAAGALLLAGTAVFLYYGIAYRYAHVPLRSATLPQPYKVGQAADGLVFSHDGKTLIVADTQLGLSQWSVPALRCENRTKQQISDGVSTAYLSPDGNTLAFADNQAVHHWTVDRTGFTELSTRQAGFRRIFGKNEYWNAFQFHTVSPSGKLAAGADPEGDVVVWNVQTGRRLYVEDARPAGQYGLPTKLCNIAFSPDDRLMAVSSLTGDDRVPIPAFNITVRAAYTGQLLRRWQWTNADIPNVDDTSGGDLDQTGLVFSPDGSAVAAADARHVAIWETKTGKLRRLLAGVDGSFGVPKRLVFFHEGQLLVGCGWGEDVPVWDVETGNLLETFYANHVTEAIAVLPDENLLATGGQDAGFYVSSATGKQVTPDSRQRLAGQQTEIVNGSIALWDISRFQKQKH